MKCYVCVLSTNNYLEGVLVLKENLDNLKSKYKLICLINEDITVENRNILSSFGIEYIEFPHITFDNVNYDNPYWIYIFDKLNIFRLTDYDKIVYLDSDFLILENLDHLFRNDTLSMPRDLPFNPDEFSSGLMVVKPDINDYNGLVKLANERNLQGDRISVQDVINEYFYGNIKTLDKKYNVTREVFNQYLCLFNPLLNKTEWQPKVIYYCKGKEFANPKIIHYIGKFKPFMIDRAFDDNYSHLYMFYLAKVREKIDVFKKNNSGDLISVIIPIYNKEKYLKRCLDSVVNQTYQNLEIILVDDKSNDKSLDICHEYASKDYRVKVIENSENRGVSYTRNVGIDNANGKYISFIDADDYIENNMIEILHYKCEIYDVDFAQCSIKLDGENLYRVKQNANLVIDRYNMLKLFFLDVVSSVVFDKLINRKLFDDGLRFDERFRKNEDTFLVVKLLEKCEKICITNDILYNYEFSKDESLTGNFNYESDKSLIWLENYLDLYIFYSFPELYSDFIVHKMVLFIKFYNKLLNNFLELKKAIDDKEFCKNLFDFKVEIQYISGKFYCHHELYAESLALIDKIEKYL